MATGGTAEVLEKIGERHLDCSICFNRFTEPKLLDCLHTFCLTCLHNLKLREGPQILKLRCPLCRKETTLPSNRLEDLPTNFTLSALVEEFEKQRQILKGQGSEIKCQSCNEQHQATLFCMDCDQFLCKDCQKVHERLAGTKSHKTCTTVQLQSGDIAYKSKLREEPKCDKHPEMNISIYCYTCQQLVCRTCSVPIHDTHAVANITEAFKKCKTETAELIAKAEHIKKQLNNKKENIAKSYKKLDTMFEDINKKISQKADKEVARIREMEQKLKQEVQEIYQDRVKTLETAEDTINNELIVAEQTLDEMNQLLAQEIKTEILHCCQKFLHSNRKLTEQPTEKSHFVPEQLLFIDFQESDETLKSLGRLTMKEKLEWKLKSEMKLSGKHVCTSIATFSNDEIVTADYGYKQLVNYSPTSNPQVPFTSKILYIPDITDPHRVAVNRLDHLLVLDGPAVKTFSREYQLLHQFQPGTDSGRKPTCLAVDEDNLIAVGYKAKGEISLHKPDGTLIRNLPTSLRVDRLVISNKRLIYTNETKGKLISTDFHGNIVFTADMQRPKSVCCDKHGNIYVAQGRQSSPSGGEICVYSAWGKYLGCVTKEFMVTVVMAFTQAGELVVGKLGFLQIYHQV
ncbi:E3 ubiquitin-protein ligase TRIM71-like isoform X1 [Acanthaster planci]|uniref:E3 ubiquitin-protein ligase TRIM71-like isoform X1 n=1 Tax=Acanthaster planci TaxID=133434 RepID=A0A8B7Y3B2_ACAPL|nr:E3 ubiquitin-protein ligase TRIM71-like isoform X1 [Acanthaster planci]